jgi:pimeloyl-ACP methyl ester carboxylesterase
MNKAFHALRLPKFAMYGFSAGGRLALRYYAKHPDRVSHLVFFGTSDAAAAEDRMKQRNIQLAVIRASWEIGSKVWQKLDAFWRVAGGYRVGAEILKG